MPDAVPISMGVNTSSSQETTDMLNFKKGSKNIFSEIIHTLLNTFKGFTRSEHKWANYSLQDVNRLLVVTILDCYLLFTHYSPVVICCSPF